MEKPLGIQNITKEEIASAKLQLASWDKDSSIKGLYDLYHKYVATTPTNKKCGACRRIIKNFWTDFLK